jgi:hypothetical protein
MPYLVVALITGGETPQVLMVFLISRLQHLMTIQRIMLMRLFDLLKV